MKHSQRRWKASPALIAISFSIISILAGCFTTFYQGWNNGGPVAISWGWPIISAFILRGLVQQQGRDARELQEQVWPTEDFELVTSHVPSEVPEDDLFAGIPLP